MFNNSNIVTMNNRERITSRNLKTNYIKEKGASVVPGGRGTVLPYSLGGVCRWVRESHTLY